MHGALRDRRQAPAVSRVIALAAAISLTAAACERIPFPPEQPVRILVLNMHAGKDAAGKPNLDGVASLVTTTGADLVLLQEVDRRTARSGNVDQLGTLATKLRYANAFGASLLHYDGGEYGIAALARGFIGYQTTIPLPVQPPETRAGGSHEPRVALLVLASLRTEQIAALNTHLDPADGAARAQEVVALANAVREQLSTGTRFVLGGDLNSTPDNPVLAPLESAALRDAWSECGSGDGFTYPADKPAKRIDYLFLSADLHCSAASVIETQVSDHRPLLVTLK